MEESAFEPRFCWPEKSHDRLSIIQSIDHYATRETKGKQSSSVIDRWTLVDLLALPFAALIRDTPWNVREIGTCCSKIKFNKSYFVQHIKRDSQRKWKAVHEKLFCCCFLRLLQAFSKNQFFISIFLRVAGLIGCLLFTDALQSIRSGSSLQALKKMEVRTCFKDLLRIFVCKFSFCIFIRS